MENDQKGRWWRRALRRGRRELNEPRTSTIVLAVLIAIGLGVLRWAGGDFWSVPGKSAIDIAATRFPLRSEELIWADRIFAIAVTTVIWTCATRLYRAHGQLARRRPWDVGLLVLAWVAGLGYLASEAHENQKLLDVAGAKLVREADALSLARAENGKWGFLLVAVLGIVALFPRRPPGRSGLDDRDPIPPPDTPPPPQGSPSWQPSENRLGIAVTGGGIRAASFALGVFQVLRARGLLSKARYVTSVSGGGYTAGAIAAVNQDVLPEDAAAAFAPHSPEEQALRRRLRYIASDWSVLVGAIARIVFGVLLNLILLYAILFAFLRPVGWLIGTPSLHPELRLDGATVAEIVRTDDDPDRDPTDAQRWTTRCGLEKDPAEAEAIPADTIHVLDDDPLLQAIEISVSVSYHCVALATPGGDQDESVVVAIATERPGVLVLERGELTVERQPSVEFTSADKCNCGATRRLDPDEAARTLRLRQPEVKVAADKGVVDLQAAAAQVTVATPADVEPKSVVELSDDLDVDTWHVALPLIAIAIATFCLAVRVIVRPDSWRQWNLVATWTGWVGLGLLMLTVVLPWLIDVVPDAVVRGASTTPSEDDWKAADWLPIPRTTVPNLVAWPLLSIASIWNFLKGRKPAAPAKPSKRSTTALIRKLFAVVRSALVGLILVLTALGTAISILNAGALNGPSGELGVVWFSSFQEIDAGPLDIDVVKWFLIALALLVSVGIGEAASWSLAPIYKRRLAHAFAWKRDEHGHAVPRQYAKDEHGEQQWARLVPPDAPPDDPEARTGTPVAEEDDAETDRHGFIDGHRGDGTELVLCCAANILGEDRAPTGRSAVSFTISRSWIGGPEVGWVATPTYLRRMGRRRTWDFTLPGAVAISGAAAAPAMGKKAIGPLGSILAMLNVRLGAWVPNPRWVANMPNGDTRPWDHNPGWPWFVREVVRRYRWEAPYLYVSDGGHWENLGLVEALRRGCTRIIAISAGGDGPSSHGAIAAAIEIARTDLDVDIELDDLWAMRPAVGGSAAALPSGREFVRDGAEPELAKVSTQGFAFGTITFRPNASRPEATTGHLLVIDATMIDGLAVDVHDYAEHHPEFPHASTGDQLFSDRDFEAYRMLGRTLAERALESPPGASFLFHTRDCTRADPT